MPVWLSRYRRIWRFHIATGCALAVIGATAMVTAAAQPGGGGSAKDPLRLFEPLMPVFSHPRCSNCHGAVDVIAGINHDSLEKADVPLSEDGDMLNGQDGNAKCLECHDEDEKNSVWRLAPKSKVFAGKDAKSLCAELRDVNGLTDAASRANFLQHLSNDQLIGFGFEGKRGMVDNDVQSPLMDRPTFINLARRWLDEGKGRCSAWSGTITQTIEQTGPMTSTTTINVTVKDGDALANVHMTGHSHSTGQGCFMRDDAFTADGDGLADLTILVNADLLSIPGFPGLPVPGVKPGIPPPPNFGDNNGYSFVLRIAFPLVGNDHFEQVSNPPTCTHTSGDSRYTFMPASGVVNKMLDPKNPDHLHDTDTQQQPGASITTNWDLTRE